MFLITQFYLYYKAIALCKALQLLGWSSESGAVLLIVPTCPIVISTMKELEELPILALSPGYCNQKKMQPMEAFNSRADIIVVTCNKIASFFGLIEEDGEATIRFLILYCMRLIQFDC